jgi:hypothetical protein
VVAAFQKLAEERSPHEIALVYDALARDRRVAKPALDFLLGPIGSGLRRVLLARLDSVLRRMPAPLPQARGVDEAGATAPPTYFLRRGEYSAKGPEVSPAFPAVLVADASAVAATIPSASRTTGRRTALANWLVQPDHPLTSRVIVNRLWQHHFGRGIVATPSDFGTMGAEPSHPELLDWLATELPRRGWSLKAMHRLMLTSAAYRQSTRHNRKAAQFDPDNSLLWRQNRQRLDAEAIRDSLLAVAGELNPALGGPCVFPELPPELTKLSSKGAIWPVSAQASDRNRRSLYVFIRRNLRYPFFEAFDRPDTNASCPRRATTTIAPQALSLLNSRLAYDAARGLAAVVGRRAASVEARIDLVYRVALARAPSALERKLALAFFAGDNKDELVNFCLALLNLNEFIYID